MGNGFYWPKGATEYGYTCSGLQMRLTYQTDNNFVLYINNSAKWANNQRNLSVIPQYVQFQSDGNLVEYSRVPYNNGQYIVWLFQAMWASGTAGEGATQFIMQADGNLVIYNAYGQALWASHTACSCY